MTELIKVAFLISSILQVSPRCVTSSLHYKINPPHFLNAPQLFAGQGRSSQTFVQIDD